MTIIKPTIGRRVWYWPSREETYEGTLRHDDVRQACDAGICFVHSDRMVNLTVADHHGNLHARTKVRLLQEGEERPAQGQAFAEWMPFQLGQAKSQDATK